MFKDQGITRRRFILLSGLGAGAAMLNSISDSWISTAIGEEAAPTENPEHFAKWFREQDNKLRQMEVAASKCYLSRVPYKECKAQGLWDEARTQVANTKVEGMRAEARNLWNQFWEKGDLYADETQELAYRARATLEIALESAPDNLDVLEDMAQMILASNPPRVILSDTIAGRKRNTHTQGPNEDLFIPLVEVREKQWEIIQKSDEAGEVVDFRIARNVSYDMLYARDQARTSDSEISVGGPGEILNWRIDHAEEGGWEGELPYMLHWLANIEAGQQFAFQPPIRFYDVCRHYARDKYRNEPEMEWRDYVKRYLQLRRYFALHHITTRVPALGNKNGLELIGNNPRNPEVIRIPLVQGSWNWIFANAERRVE